MRMLSVYQKNDEVHRVLINFVLAVMKDTTHTHTVERETEREREAYNTNTYRQVRLNSST